MVGRYPDYDVFDAASTWDSATAEVIAARMRHGQRALTFFSAAEQPTLRAFCDVATGQDGEPRVPVAEMVDEALDAGRLDGYQYDGMPDDRDTWHIVLRGLDETARRRYGASGFAALDDESREGIVGHLADGTLSGDSWDTLDPKRAFSVCMRAMLSAFYSHPWAWNEIGFGGPAYPHGFMRLGPLAVLEPYEKPGATDEDPLRVGDGEG
jgi:hypothetical protein